MCIRYKNIKIAVAFYVLIPVLVFYLGWLNMASAAVFISLAIAAYFFLLRDCSNQDGKISSVTLTKRKIVCIAVIAFLWCFFAGQGKFVHQTSDHMFRNSILRDLITKEWPVIYDNEHAMLCYYFAHWMVPAALGKFVFGISNSAFAGYLAGNICLLLWSALGCFLVLLLVVIHASTGEAGRQKAVFAVLLFIFFSGLDYVGCLLRGIYWKTHLEWWAEWFQYSSNTTCLYWVYNQTIVPWMLMLCLMNEKKMKDFGILAVFSFPYAPFPFVGIAFFCFLNAIEKIYKSAKDKSLISFFKDVLSPQNILGILSIAVIYICYYKTNARMATPETSFRFSDVLVRSWNQHDWTTLGKYLIVYFAFIILDSGIYAAIIARKRRPDFVFIGVCISLLLIPLFEIGKGCDFCMRVSIPNIVYLCILFTQVVIKELPQNIHFYNLPMLVRQKRFLLVAFIVFAIGAVTPSIEIGRELVNTVKTPYRKIIDYSSIVSLPDNGLKENFLAIDYEESLYYRLFSKK